MRALTMNEIDVVAGGPVPVAVWVVVTVGSAVIGAVGGYLAGSSTATASATVTTEGNVTLTCVGGQMP